MNSSEEEEEATKIATIRRQTSLTDEAEIRTKLAAFGGDELCVIKDALGLPTEKRQTKATSCSLNQEIYRQLRKQLGVQDEKRAAKQVHAADKSAT